MFTKFARKVIFFLAVAGSITFLAFQNNNLASAAWILETGPSTIKTNTRTFGFNTSVINSNAPSEVIDNSSTKTNIPAQGTNDSVIETNAPPVGSNASNTAANPPTVIAPVFTQPVDPAGKLLLSSWLDPDGSDQDQFVWDDFTLSTTQAITEIDWVGGYDPLRQGKGGPVLDFEVSIYPSIAAGTEPAVANPPLVNYMVAGNAGETSIGMLGGIEMYTYAFVLPNEFLATGGVKYWVQIVATQQGTLPDWGLAQGTEGNGSHYVKGAGAGGDVRFYSAPGDAAFTLLGPIQDVPTDILLTSEAVDENRPANTVVAMLAALDPDPGAVFTFSLACAVAGADDGSFNIVGAVLQTSTLFDYEAKNVLNICIRVENGVGATLDKAITIAVINVNEAPTGISLAGSTVDENQPANTLVGTLGSADPDAGATFTFSLSCALVGVDDASFNISGTKLQTSAVFDFESKSSYAICIRVTDQGGLSFDQNFLITVNNLNEGPLDISLNANLVDENQPVNTPVGTLSAADPDPGAAFTFSLECAAAGADDASFNISGTILQTSAAFDFEAKSTYAICVRVSDQGGTTFDKNFAIEVNDVNEAPTGSSLAGSAIAENQPIYSVVGNLSAADPDAGATFTFSLACAVLGADDASFIISGANLQTSAVFDFEAKAAYNICIRVTDQGGLSFDQIFAVTVNNVNEAPTGVSLSNSAVVENQPLNTMVGSLSATDPDAGETLTFSLSCAAAGADDGSFNISGASLQSSSVFDFEAKSSYSICVRVTDQSGLTFDKAFNVAVNNTNEAPIDISLSNNAVDENQPANTPIGSLTAADPDAGETLTFSLSCAAPGADDASFNLSGSSLQTSAAFDFETMSTYAVCIRATDAGGLWFDKNFAISVNDLDETTNIPGEVTGHASTGKGQTKADLRLDVQFTAGAAAPTGDLTFMDHEARLRLKATSFTLLVISGSHATITGYATVDKMTNVPFTVEVYDNGTGPTDVIAVHIPGMNGYSFQDVVSKHDLTVTLRKSF